MNLITVEQCQRCGKDHKLQFEKLINPIDSYEWYSICPETKQPVLMKVVYRTSFQYRLNNIKAAILRPYWAFRSKYTPCKCGFECDWTYPYGFAPEAGCPVHDK